METAINQKTHKREYASWQSMKTRCYNKRDSHYKRYGGRGIKVCNEWLVSFQQFVSDMGKRPDVTDARPYRQRRKLHS